MAREFDALQRLETEDRIPLKQASSLFDDCPSARTLRRYVIVGRYCPILADRVYLEGFRSIGNTWITSVQAVKRFIARTNGGDA